MKNENVQKWINEMRTTDKAQATHRLCILLTGGDRSYCCLGLGSELMGLTGSDGGGDAGTLRYGAVATATMAPVEFLLWLGINTTTSVVEGDVFPDWGEVGELETLSTNHKIGTLAASGLNDRGFTFAQIADIFDYFGVDPDRW